MRGGERVVYEGGIAESFMKGFEERLMMVVFYNSEKKKK